MCLGTLPHKREKKPELAQDFSYFATEKAKLMTDVWTLKYRSKLVKLSSSLTANYEPTNDQLKKSLQKSFASTYASAVHFIGRVWSLDSG